MRIIDRFPVTFSALAVLIVVLNFSYGVANAGQQPSAKPEAKATPTPTPDPLAFTAAEQAESRPSSATRSTPTGVSLVSANSAAPFPVR